MIASGEDVPIVIVHGLRFVKAPALPKGYQIKCDFCGCSVTATHVPLSQDCEEARVERNISQADEW